MTDKTHQLIGLTLATAGVIYLHPETQFTWSVITTIGLGSFIGSILPDIDQPTSDVWDVLPLGGLLGKVTSRALGGHRNLSHSLLGVVLFSSLMIFLAHRLPPNGFIIPQLLIQSFEAGFIGHLLADSLTVIGIPIFWPFGPNIGFPPAPFEGARIVTGKWFEHVIVFPAVLLLLASLVLHFPTRFCAILPLFCRSV